MSNGSLLTSIVLPRGAPALAGLVLLLGLASRAAAAGYGNCEVTGVKGAYHIAPVVPGQLTVEVSLPEPGWYNGDTPDTIKDGYEYCMAANIAYRTGLDNVVVRNVAWPQLIGGSTTNYDIALAEATITEARKKVVDFSIPYFSSDIALLVKKETPADNPSVNVKDLLIGAHQGTTGATFVMDVLKPAKPVRVYPTVPGMIAALVAGQIDAAAGDTSYMLTYAAKSHGTLTVIGQYHTGEQFGAVYPKGSADEATFDKIIQSLKDDGTLDKLSAKYLAPVVGSDPAKVPYLNP